jgi:tetratricopeptide (TPR) repeat protein
MAEDATSVADLLRHGVARHQTGDLQGAEAAYRQILAVESTNPDAWHLLGVIAHQVGRNDVAVDYVGRAIGYRSSSAVYHNSLGSALAGLGRLTDAEASYRNAVLLEPLFAEAFGNLGATQAARGELGEAIESYRKALRIKPDVAPTRNNYAVALAQVGLSADAEVNFREAARLAPGFAEAHSNLAKALNETGRFVEAEPICRTAVALKPDFPAAHEHLGHALRGQNRQAEAETSYRTALKLDPNDAGAHDRLGVTLHELGRVAEAEACYRTALRLNPSLANVHFHLGLLLLLLGRFEEGWREHEWRISAHATSVPTFDTPRWAGEEIGDRTLLLHAEQGFGDTIQFCRYAPLIVGAAKVVLAVQPPLVRLMRSLRGDLSIVAADDVPAHDLHCSLLSLPHVLGSRIEASATAAPYLAADPALVQTWRDRLAGAPGFKVGLVWAGGLRPGQPELLGVHRRRSMTLDAMAPIAGIPGVSFVSLQLGEPAQQASRPPAAMVLHDFTGELHDFSDTAALVEALDLVISVDTAVAHLAGAMGKPVWLLNRFDTDWRWLLERNDSPWYPSMRVFRQPSPGDWRSVMVAVREALPLWIEG